ncbi:N-acetyltransferase [Actinorhabdospora filicis]|uniref:N-acetyltransferase n=1 Tax=Actinorhabdospora filicis TaxID=1785913 RepID=A0A9W6WBP9_9ACTN|nr:GNAT family N-acetyltransferase [Actinorhabdospora filicis]GLZ79791.1 N-acetyltransferase [Actinorhabdospora filicis]
MDLELTARGPVADDEMHTLFDAAWGGTSGTAWGPLLERSLTWVTARRDGRLVGFVNVATDGGAHAFLLDTTVHPDEQRKGLGRLLIDEAAADARARGAHWLHVDFEPHLTEFYRGAGFRDTPAGLMRLQ